MTAVGEVRTGVGVGPMEAHNGPHPRRQGVAARLNCFGEQVYQREAFRLGQIEWQNAPLREVIGFKI